MGKRRLTAEKRDAAFRELNRRFTVNEEGDAAVEALNRLPADDRAIMIWYLACGENKTDMAATVGCSWPTIADRLKKIRTSMKEEYQRIIAEKDDDDIF